MPKSSKPKSRPQDESNAQPIVVPARPPHPLEAVAQGDRKFDEKTFFVYLKRYGVEVFRLPQFRAMVREWQNEVKYAPEDQTRDDCAERLRKIGKALVPRGEGRPRYEMPNILEEFHLLGRAYQAILKVIDENKNRWLRLRLEGRRKLLIENTPEEVRRIQSEVPFRGFQLVEKEGKRRLQFQPDVLEDWVEKDVVSPYPKLLKPFEEWTEADFDLVSCKLVPCCADGSPVSLKSQTIREMYHMSATEPRNLALNDLACAYGVSLDFMEKWLGRLSKEASKRTAHVERQRTLIETWEKTKKKETR